MSTPDRRAVLAALTAFGLDLPALATRAAGAGGGAPVFSGAVAPGTIEGRKDGDLPRPARDGAWAERAALLEYDGGWPRALAEAIADRLMAMEAAGAGPEAWAALDAELIGLEAERDGRGSPPASIPSVGSPHPVTGPSWARPNCGP